MIVAPPAAPEATELIPERVRNRLRELGYPLPEPGELLRLALVGQTTYFHQCALEEPSAWASPAFFDFRSGADAHAMVERVRAFDPHVVLVFRPELIPARAFNGLHALTLGWLTEPLPRGSETDPHPDLVRRLEYLRAADRANFDRIVCFDPLVIPAASAILPVWRSVPLPVADSLYVDEIATDPGVRPLFIGRSTPHREWMLEMSKHKTDLLHVGHGTSLEDLRELLRGTTIGVNLHNEAYPSFENRVAILMAAGRLVVSEPLSPTHGLEPGIDYIEATNPWELYKGIWSVRHYPEAWELMRLRGRVKAELFRASRVYPRLLANTFHDVAVFGSERPRPAS
ncbi:MAG TPA: hypothetical protein VN606_00030 [Thermoleophilaceae bacterium]|nr:hypothetical protein [Thermoleophilaceae bacterium]